ncbi:MAG: hypothetical protein MJZ46_07820 [Bacteroidales bacterium]|nr:hypothetical protein [Bacteroidales bacterium]
MKIKHLFFVLMACSLVFVSCKKEENKPQNDDRTPIAMRDNTGKMVSLVNVEKLQAFIDAKATKDNQIVIESVSVTDKTNDDPFFLNISLIDVNEGQAYSVSLIGEYFEEISNYLYINNDVKRGNTGCKCPDGEILQLVDGKEVEPEPCYLPPGLFVGCNKQHCSAGSCTPMGSHGDYYCSDCTPKPGYEVGETNCVPMQKVHKGFWGFLLDVLGQYF